MGYGGHSAKKIDPAEIATYIAPRLSRPLPDCAYQQLAAYIELLDRWNRKMNLTAIRSTRTFIELHLVECLLAAELIPSEVKTVLDFGSGAGLPGIPIQIAHPDLRVTLAESQNKKAAFLSEVLRTLNLPEASVHAGRVEELPPKRAFDLVALRAVDKMDESLKSATLRLRSSGWCLLLTSQVQAEKIYAASIMGTTTSRLRSNIRWLDPVPVPDTQQRVLLFGRRET